jgi:hypothetical protein
MNPHTRSRCDGAKGDTLLTELGTRLAIRGMHDA